MNDRNQLRQKIQAARDEACAALVALQAGGNHGGRDLFKQVTGASSVDNAVAEARRIIDAYDRILRDLEAGDPNGAQVAIHVLGAMGRAVVA